MRTLTISGGIFKHKKIHCPPHDIRPVMNKVREAVFTILEHQFHYNINHTTPHNTSYTFLDLFSGSGLMAIESISRGFTHAISVEKDRRKWRIIQKNFSLSSSSFMLIRNSAEKYLLKSTRHADVVYVDPPFDYAYKNDILHKIIRSKVCSPKTTIILHLPSKESVELKIENFHNIDTRKYGGSKVCFFRSL